MFSYRTGFFFLIGVIAGAIVGVGGYFTYSKLTSPATPGSRTEIVPSDAAVSDPATDMDEKAEEMKKDGEIIVGGNEKIGIVGQDQFGSYGILAGVRQYEKKYVTSSLKVTWHRGAQRLSAEEVQALQRTDIPAKDKETKPLLCDYRSGIETIDEGEPHSCATTIYKAGVITAPREFVDETLYLVFTPVEGMGTHYSYQYAIYDENAKKFIFFRYPMSRWEIENSDLGNWVLGVIPYTFTELREPQKLLIPNETSELYFEKTLGPKGFGFGSVFAADNRGGIVNVFSGETKNTYNPKEIVFTDPVYGPVYFRDDSYQIVLADGAVAQYELRPYFLKTPEEKAEKIAYRLGYTADIEWSGSKNNAGEMYELSGDINISGCGAGIVRCTNVVNDKEWFDESKLVEIGKTAAKEPVYELSDKATNTYYKAMFDFGYEGAKSISYQDEGLTWEQQQEKLKSMSDKDKYAEFLADEPLFFWKDYRGKWRVYKKLKYTTLVECAKPVIYLYPEEEMDVSVQVEPDGGFSKVEPAYPEGGWFVRATPESSLYNYANNTSYPYLFWEGFGYDYVQPKKGFVFARDEVASGVREKLYALGMNEKETEDFMEFWEPRLQEKDYAFVTFVPQPQFDEMAPLTVSPKPDTVIRVFMDYTPLDEPMAVEPLEIKTPQRNGFTVVEWGGALHR